MPNHRDLSSPVPWRRSLRAAQQRRLRLALRRRRIFRGRAGVLLAVACRASPPAARSPRTPRRRREPVECERERHPARRAAEARRRRRRRQRPATRARRAPLPAPQRPDRRRHRRPADARRARHQRAPAPSSTASRSSGATRQRDASRRIAQCESGGDPTAVSADGTYRGKYQFTAPRGALGGSGDPAAAPESSRTGSRWRCTASAAPRPGPPAPPSCSATGVPRRRHGPPGRRSGRADARGLVRGQPAWVVPPARAGGAQLVVGDQRPSGSSRIRSAPARRRRPRWRHVLLTTVGADHRVVADGRRRAGCGAVADPDVVADGTSRL